ncbi:uncharacterized protein FIESC28_09234 [Fusarium coffeatum]|uniref:Uncharacterized protein n=1 Tax=Fusarium coffeatum TaxID=231269 RepID=A0A366R3Y0_9HYPO|nr:uncharacterized protein FIESC28_09234 [Fusarium coffeatum]RBR10960.1 hypothetical protein FIESC28_09234 [Fusarium coffeatum]
MVHRYFTLIHATYNAAHGYGDGLDDMNGSEEPLGAVLDDLGTFTALRDPPGAISSPPYANWAWQTPLSDDLDLDLNFNLQLPLTDLSLFIPHNLYGTSHYRKWCLLWTTNLYLPRWYHESTVPANSAAQPSCIYSKLI